MIHVSLVARTVKVFESDAQKEKEDAHQEGRAPPTTRYRAFRDQFIKRSKDENQGRNLPEKRAEHFISALLDRPYRDRFGVSPLLIQHEPLSAISRVAASTRPRRRPPLFQGRLD